MPKKADCDVETESMIDYCIQLTWTFIEMNEWIQSELLNRIEFEQKKTDTFKQTVWLLIVLLKLFEKLAPYPLAIWANDLIVIACYGMTCSNEPLWIDFLRQIIPNFNIVANFHMTHFTYISIQMHQQQFRTFLFNVKELVTRVLSFFL